MSHFTVLVIGDKVEEQLAPYHEFECTGYNDEYVQDIDITEEAKKEYEGRTVLKLKDGNGDFHSPYEDRFYKEEVETLKNGKERKKKVKFIPEGFEEVEIPENENR